MTAQTETKRQQLRAYLHRRTAEGECYLKSKFVARDLDLTTREIGQLFADLRKEADDLDVERWAYSSATTWRVERR
ncbi:hypothetical protein HLRTI_002101 [Halorhabdus tiamatea SARL4B]|uniref:DUF7123 domain-containing protein n=1 Tax=Halorhabdus tiamatea SARL4B TaxID=1033806 RepID=F7PL75_9EURY|nr:hypothetical protein [Halorhabdus tiamatea]ERJ05830.1 hypothetical protein HLRTI_002101 [Halorhabdus tiamatea SARL4B]CCQ34488.1 conserved hypothetical protein [Halorhabdus tiamatea SARL4B]